MDERDELRAAVRGFIERLGGTATSRTVMESESGFDPQLWTRLSQELGLAGLAISEEHGGQGATFVELGVVFEELGRSLLPVPMLASSVLVAGATDDAEVLSRVAGGTPAALCVAVDDAHVIDGAAAEFFLVSGGDGLRAVEASDVRRTPLPTLDQTRRQARVEIDPSAGRRVEGDVTRAIDLGRVALASECVGGAQWCLDATVDYSKTREQFGRAIGSFQALKHRMADLYVAVETATSTARHAAWVAANEPEKLPLVAAAAKAYCADVYARVAQEAIQLHGGIGFTWEHDAHLHLKRAWSTRQLLGEPNELRRQVADLIEI